MWDRGHDLEEYFSGERPWAHLYRRLKHLPAHSNYQSKLLMNDDLGMRRAFEPDPEELPPIPPLGYTPEIMILLRICDLIKENMRVTMSVFGSSPPQMEPEPRPELAEARWRERIERDLLDQVARALGAEV